MKETKIILDPYTFLPSYGESEVFILFKNNELIVDIYYDGQEIEEKKTIIFKNTFFHIVSSFPGVEIYSIPYNNDNYSSLVEFEESELKRKWENYFDKKYKLRHLKISFLSVNKSIEVICEDLIVN